MPPLSDQLRIGITQPPEVGNPRPHHPTPETANALALLAQGLAERGHQIITITECHQEALASLTSCDIVHDHAQVGPTLRSVTSVPLVVTNQAEPARGWDRHYPRQGGSVRMIARSRRQAAAAPPGVEVEAVIHRGLDLTRYHFDPAGGDHLLTYGRMSPTGGLDWAAEAARRAGIPLLVCGRIRTPLERQFYQYQLRPLLGRGIDYVGDVDLDERLELIRGARAVVCPTGDPAAAGVVAMEALACGTPTIARPTRELSEVIDHGTTGFLAATMGDLTRAVRRCEHLDRATCRGMAEQRFSHHQVAARHEQVYRRLVEAWPTTLTTHHRDLASLASA